MALDFRSNDTIFAPIVFTLCVYVLLFFIACAKAVYSTFLIYNLLNSEPINLAISNMLSTSLIIGIPLGMIVYFHSKKNKNNVTKLSKSRKILSGVLIVVFILCLAPIPLPMI